MKLLVIVINEHEYVQDVLEALLEIDLHGVTIVDTESVMQILAQEAPIFAGLRQMFSGTKEYNKTIFGLTDRDNILDELDATLKEVNLDLSRPGLGYAFTIPLEGVLKSDEEE